jgi:hypothetical protein
MRSNRLFSLVCALALVAAVGSTPAAGQAAESRIYTSVSEWVVPFDKSAEFEKELVDGGKPVVDRLVAEGVLTGWGCYATVVHQPDLNTHGCWISATSYADIAKAQAELAKIPVAPVWQSVTGHWDYLLESLAQRGVKTTASSGYLSVHMYTVQPGKGQEWKAMWDKYSRPVLDDLMAKGHVLAYQVDVQWVHTHDPGQRYIAVVTPSAAAEDQVTAAFGAAWEKMSEADRAARRTASEGLVVPGAHRDYFARIIALGHR